jgi:hypothetical protein
MEKGIDIFKVGKCSENADTISAVSWIEEAPTFIINFLNEDPSKPGRLDCFNRENLLQYFKDKKNHFAKWVQNVPTKPMNDIGYNGKPDPKQGLYFKIYPHNTYLLIDKTLKDHINKDGYICDAKIIEKNVRIGNLDGEFGVGQLHGQLPGVTVYQLVSCKKIEIEEPKEVTELRKMKDPKEIVSKLTDEIIEKYGRQVLKIISERYEDETNKSIAARFITFATDNTEVDPFTTFTYEFPTSLFNPLLEYGAQRSNDLYNFQSKYILPAYENHNDIAGAKIVCMLLNDGKTWNFLVNLHPEQSNTIKITLKDCREEMIKDWFEACLHFRKYSEEYTRATELGGDILEIGVIDGAINTKVVARYLTLPEVKDILYIRREEKNKETQLKYIEDNTTTILDRLRQLYGFKPVVEKPVPSAPKKSGKTKFKYRKILNDFGGGNRFREICQAMSEAGATAYIGIQKNDDAFWIFVEDGERNISEEKLEQLRKKAMDNGDIVMDRQDCEDYHAGRGRVGVPHGQLYITLVNDYPDFPSGGSLDARKTAIRKILSDSDENTVIAIETQIPKRVILVRKTSANSGSTTAAILGMYNEAVDEGRAVAARWDMFPMTLDQSLSLH